MPSTTRSTKSTKNVPAQPVPAELRKLAQRILAARKNGQPYDGENGICADPSFPTIRTATAARKLLRKTGLAETGNGIAPSYVRTDEFRAEESARRRAAKAAAEQPAPKTPRKRTPKAAPKTTPRRKASGK